MNSQFESLISDFLRKYSISSYRKGDIVIRGDDFPTGVYFIKKGMVKMSFIGKEGNELGVNILKPGAFFPVIWALGEMENTYYFQALSRTAVVRVPKEDFIDFLKENPDLLFDLTRRLLIGMDGLLFNVKYLLSGTSKSKVSVIIYSLSRRFGVKVGDDIKIDLDITHQELAQFAGLTRETTTITINKLVREGILEQTNRRLIIKDIIRLQNLFR